MRGRYAWRPGDLAPADPDTTAAGDSGHEVFAQRTREMCRAAGIFTA
jgi:hypothetical protein